MQKTKYVYYTVLFISFAIAIASFRFMLLDIKLVFPDFLDHIMNRKAIFLAHISAAPIALFLGLINMHERRTAKRKKMHRWAGRFYGVSILIGGLSGLALAYNAVGGPIAMYGFGFLSVWWILTTGNAIRFAIAKNFAAHRTWMIRSFALTFAAVTLRIYLLGFVTIGDYSYAQASIWLAWMCWVPNALVAEWWIRAGKSTTDTNAKASAKTKAALKSITP